MFHGFSNLTGATSINFYKEAPQGGPLLAQVSTYLSASSWRLEALDGPVFTHSLLLVILGTKSRNFWGSYVATCLVEGLTKSLITSTANAASCRLSSRRCVLGMKLCSALGFTCFLHLGEPPWHRDPKTSFDAWCEIGRQSLKLQLESTGKGLVDVERWRSW